MRSPFGDLTTMLLLVSKRSDVEDEELNENFLLALARRIGDVSPEVVLL